MSIRINRRSNPVPVVLSKDGAPPVPAEGEPPVPVEKGYWEQLLLLFPTEVTAFYLAGINIIPVDQMFAQWIWVVLGVIASIVLKGEQLKKHPQDPDTTIHRDWSHITVSAISFLIWAYGLGGVFTLANLKVTWLAALLVLAWTFGAPRLLPIFDKVFAPKKQ